MCLHRVLAWPWYSGCKSERFRQKVGFTMSTTTNTELVRGTNWATQFAFHTGRHVVAGLPDSYYVAEKARQVKSDTEALLRFLDTFIATGDLAHLADYRGRLEVMLDEVDRGAWYAIVAEEAR